MAPSSTGKPGAANAKASSGSGPADSARKRRKVPDNVSNSVEYATSVGRELLEKLRKSLDSKGNPIAEHFLELPDRKKFPDYYEIIGLPIALETIEDKLDEGAYETVTALESDVKRMISNAKQYNERGSEIFLDAEKIRKMTSTFMEPRNPAYRDDPQYVPGPTPIPDDWRGQQTEGAMDATTEKDPKRIKLDTGVPDTASGAMSTRKSGRHSSDVPVSAKKEHTDKASTDAKRGVTVDDSFAGMTFQQAQEKIVANLLNLKDRDGDPVFKDFLFLPNRELKDYYKTIKHPLALSRLQKDVRGMSSRQTLGQSPYQTWDAFVKNASPIWENAQAYNEDSSVIHKRADHLEATFSTMLAKAKQVVPEPAHPKVKLTMKSNQSSQERGKLTLKFGGPKQDISLDKTSGSDSTAGTPGGIVADQSVMHSAPSAVNTAPHGTPIIARNDVANGGLDSITNGHALKREPSFAQNSANVTGQAGHFQPHPLAVVGKAGSEVATHQPKVVQPHMQAGSPLSSQTADDFNTRFRKQGTTVADALIVKVTIMTHPDIVDAKPWPITLPASPAMRLQCKIIDLHRKQWKLQFRPTFGKNILERQVKVSFIHNDGPPIARAGGDDLDPVYEVEVKPGTNWVELDVWTGALKGSIHPVNERDVNHERIMFLLRYAY